MEVLLVCVLIQVMSVTLAYRYEPNLPAMPFRDYNKDLERASSAQASWDAYSQYPGDMPDTSLLTGRKTFMEDGEDLTDGRDMTRSRQLQVNCTHIALYLHNA